MVTDRRQYSLVRFCALLEERERERLQKVTRETECLAPFTQFKPPPLGSPLKFSGAYEGATRPCPPIRSWSPIQWDSLAINFDFDIRLVLRTPSLCLLSGFFCLCTKQDAVVTLYVLMLLRTYFPTVMKSMLSMLNDVIKAWCSTSRLWWNTYIIMSTT